MEQYEWFQRIKAALAWAWSWVAWAAVWLWGKVKAAFWFTVSFAKRFWQERREDGTVATVRARVSQFVASAGAVVASSFWAMWHFLRGLVARENVNTSQVQGFIGMPSVVRGGMSVGFMLALLVGIGVAVWLYGESRYRDGVAHDDALDLRIARQAEDDVNKNDAEATERRNRNEAATKAALQKTYNTLEEIPTQVRKECANRCSIPEKTLQSLAEAAKNL